MRPRDMHLTSRSLVEAGLALCIVIAVAWAVSARFSLGWEGRRVGIELATGSVEFALWESQPAQPPRQPQGWFAARIPIGLRWWPERWTLSSSRWVGQSIAVPLWMPLLPVAGATGVLWWRNRRARAGRRCPHHRADRVPGVCPECLRVAQARP